LNSEESSSERDLLASVVVLEEKVSFHKNEIQNIRIQLSPFNKGFGNDQFSMINSLPHLLDVGPEAMRPALVVGNPRPDPGITIIYSKFHQILSFTKISYIL